MYIWVILATFITILYSFNLATRSDMRAIYVEPQAEAVVAKLVVQHKGAQKYIQDKSPPTNDQSVVSYYPGEISFETLRGYLPYGFNANRSDSDFTTIMYCLDKTSAKLGQAASGCGGTPSCCSNANSVNYLVTFGCVPQKWRNIKTGRPNNDLLNAMQNVVGAGTDFGYADAVSPTDPKNGLQSTMAVKGRESSWVAIPQYIIDSTAVGGARSFSKVCVKGIVDADGNEIPRDCAYCMIYITPFDG